MSLSIKKILRLPRMSELEVIAGEAGLDRQVTSTAFLGYEPLFEEDINRSHFDRNTFVITSLLFAKDREDLIEPTVRGLVERGCSALAFDGIFFETLPPSVLSYADRENFPIFRINDVSFDDLIFTIMEAIRLADVEILSEQTIHKMLYNNMARTEIDSLVLRLSVLFRSHIICFNLNFKDPLLDPDKALAKGNNYFSKSLKNVSITANYRGSHFLLISLDSPDISDYRRVLGDIYPSLLNEEAEEAYYLAHSDVLPTKDNLDLAFKQAYIAAQACKVMEVPRLAYKDMGTLRFLIPLADEPELEAFRRQVVDKLKAEASLYETASLFLANSANIKKTAQACFVHPNTIRYRISRMKDLLNMESQSDYVLYEILSIALKLDRIKALSIDI